MPEGSLCDAKVDEELRDLVLSSPEEGWKVFLEAHSRFIHRIIKRFRFSPEDCEEIHQEVLHRLLRNDCRALRVWEPSRASLRGFLSVITIRTVISFYRSSFCSFSRNCNRSPNDMVIFEEFITTVDIPASTPADRLHRAQLVNFFRTILDEWVQQERLNPVDREVVLLRLRGLSFREISGLIGISLTNAISKFSRLKPLLRRKLEQAGVRPEV
jgi:RNA polymerase sigma factor (sigma-70 family)